jgi:energy-coupling factor transporter ATP-binding protein EcfA2
MSDMPPRPKEYKPGSGKIRYVRFAQDWLGVEPTYVLKEVAKAIEEHQQVLVLGANGIGKSFSIPTLGLAAMYTNPETIVHVTAGTSTTLKNTIWKGGKSLFNHGKENYGLPGRRLDGTREIRSGLGEEWYFECISPRYPDDLEGPHNEHVIYFIEEADKPGVSAEHIDSVRSTATSENDRVIVVANPPTDETNVVYDLVQSDEWHTLQFASWDSHNVRVERGVEEGERIGGLVDSSKIKADWEEYHDIEWPGLERVIEWSDPESENFRDDLHELWYKRRAGIVPPDSSEYWRPWEVQDVKNAFAPNTEVPKFPTTFGVDVARSNDMTIGSGKHNAHIKVHYEEQGTNHVTQKDDLIALLDSLNAPQTAVDAVGEGSGLADELDNRFNNIKRYSNGAKPAQENEYYDSWAEALDLFGKFLKNGGTFSNPDLKEELLMAARTIRFETKALTSRGGEVIKATPKSELKDELGHSPDYLDSAIMANWLDMAQTKTVNRRKARVSMHKGR